MARDKPWDERTTALMQDLDEIGLGLKGGRPRAPLGLLTDDRMRRQFLVLMERHLDTLAG